LWATYEASNSACTTAKIEKPRRGGVSVTDQYKNASAIETALLARFLVLVLALLAGLLPATLLLLTRLLSALLLLIRLRIVWIVLVLLMLRIAVWIWLVHDVNVPV
jgi:hypothetical protein